MLIVSACLLGINCRYDGSHRLNLHLLKRSRKEDCIPVCPEQLGGLSTPRKPVFICGGNGFDVLDGRCQVFDAEGNDLTGQLIIGSQEALKITRLRKVRKAVFKERSPSCGVNFTASDQGIIAGPGVTASLFIREGIEVISDESL